jgi:hypothetical protein
MLRSLVTEKRRKINSREEFPTIDFRFLKL